MSPVSRRARASTSRIGAIARLRMRRVLRTRIAFAAVLLALLPWMLVDSRALSTRLGSLVEFSLVGLTVITAGAIADDIDSGEYAIMLTHDASPLDVLAGQALASLALSLVLVALAVPVAIWGTEGASIVALAQSLAWLIALLVGWLALALLCGTVLEGKANAVAMGALLVLIPVLVAPGVLDRLPVILAGAVRATLQWVPQASHATAMIRAALDDSPAPRLAPAVLVVSPALYFLLAAVRLMRLEAAGRLTQ